MRHFIGRKHGHLDVYINEKNAEEKRDPMLTFLKKLISKSA